MGFSPIGSCLNAPQQPWVDFWEWNFVVGLRGIEEAGPPFLVVPQNQCMETSLIIFFILQEGADPFRVGALGNRWHWR
eukprot:12118464-Ditylum_brightwellii.AAC.1